MTALLPTRVSIYDFLFEDTQPIDAVLADMGNISLPQARIIIENGIQAITSSLLAYNQVEGPDAVLKKLLNRTQVKELRKHNAFNFRTMKTAMQYAQNSLEALFVSTDVQKSVTKRLSDLAQLPTQKTRTLLGALSLLCIRELAILADFAQLDANELDQWLRQQPQFLRLERTTSRLSLDDGACDNEIFAAPTFDPIWLELTNCKLPAQQPQQESVQMPHYAKVIGRTQAPNNGTTSLPKNNDQLIVDTQNNSDILTFCSIDSVTLPYQRWLLQLAKISDIYLSRNRLKIAPEPVQPPSRPFVSFGFMDKKFDDSSPATTKSASDSTDNQPFWKNPVLILLVLVLGTLTLMAVGKYQYKKSKAIENPSNAATLVVSDNRSLPNH